MKPFTEYLLPLMNRFPERNGLTLFISGFRLSGANGTRIGPLFSASMQGELVEEFQNSFNRPDLFWMSTGHSVYLFQKRIKVKISEFDIEHEGETSHSVRVMTMPPEWVMEKMRDIARRHRVFLYFGLHRVHMMKYREAYMAIGTMNPFHELAIQIGKTSQEITDIYTYSIQLQRQQSEELEEETDAEEEDIPTLEEVWAARDLHAISD